MKKDGHLCVVCVMIERGVQEEGCQEWDARPMAGLDIIVLRQLPKIRKI